MRKTNTNTAPKAVTFTASKFAAATVGLVTACTAIDKAIAGTAKQVKAWAMQTAAGLSANAITIETVEQALIANSPKAKTIADCGSTVKGHFYSMKRIAANGQLDRLINGEALSTVARESKPVQQQQTGKRAKAGDKAKVISLNDSLSALGYWLDAAMANSELAAELAANEKLAECVAKIGKLSSVALSGAGKARAGTTIKNLATRKDRPGSGKVVKLPRRKAVKAVAAPVKTRSRKAA